MTTRINRYISENNVCEALAQCLRENNYHLGLLLAKFYQTTETDPRFYGLYHKLNEAVNGCSEEVEVNVVSNTNDNNKNDHTYPDIIFEEDDIKKQTLLENHEKDKPLMLFSRHRVENDHDTIMTDIPPNEDIGKTYPELKVMMLCNWCDSKTICEYWNRMSKGNFTWDNIKMVWEEPCDYYVVINCPPISVFPDTKKTLLFHMEPNMHLDPQIWGDWGRPPVESFKFCGTHEREYNNNEWHISKTYSQLKKELIFKDRSVSTTLSTVLSNKYYEPGHIKRVDFVKYLDSKGMNLHVYGSSTLKWNNYKGSLSYLQKDNGLLPYKYTFNAENNSINNYYTEKLIDGILSECLVFYWGCPNVEEYIDERAFVRLNLEDFEHDMLLIERAIKEKWWERRLPYIKEAKNKILDELQLFPRLKRILSE